MYHLDKRGWFTCALAYLCKQWTNTKTNFDAWCTWINEKTGYTLVGDNLFLILGTMSIMAILITVKKLQLRAQELRLKEQKEREDDHKREDSDSCCEEAHSSENESDSNGPSKQFGCEKITEEDYEYQTKVHTKQEIRRLVNSETYDRLMRVKGSDPNNWNWQLHDKSEGFFPTNDDEKFEGAGANDRVHRNDGF